MRQFGFIGGLLLLAASSIGAKKSGKGNFGKGLQNLSFHTRKSKQHEGVLAVSFPKYILTKTFKALLNHIPVEWVSYWPILAPACHFPVFTLYSSIPTGKGFSNFLLWFGLSSSFKSIYDLF